MLERVLWICGCAAVVLGFAESRAGANAVCSVTSVGFAPINDLGSGLYLNQYQGGLYPGGMNQPPAAHFTEGRARALAVQPVNGKYVLLSIGLSNTTQEFCSQNGLTPCNSWTFMGQAAADSRVNHNTLVIVNGAAGGQTAMTWDMPTDANYDMVRDQRLAPTGVTEGQVQAIWLKVADSTPSIHLPAANADAFVLEGYLGGIMRAFKVRYPNIKVVFISSRIYAGYAGYPNPPNMLNPEPYAYESGFSVKWMIEAQINQMAGGPVDPTTGDLNYNTVAPWVAWGPYLWADGTQARSDGLQWFCSDLIANDGTHPSMTGQQKVGTMLMNFMLNSKFATPWFRNCELADMNHDGKLDGLDISLFVVTLLDPASATVAQQCSADCTQDGSVTNSDIGPFVDRILLGS